MIKTALVCGAGGFIGGHLVKRLKAEGYWVRVEAIGWKAQYFLKDGIARTYPWVAEQVKRLAV